MNALDSKMILELAKAYNLIAETGPDETGILEIGSSKMTLAYPQGRANVLDGLLRAIKNILPQEG